MRICTGVYGDVIRDVEISFMYVQMYIGLMNATAEERERERGYLFTWKEIKAPLNILYDHTTAVPIIKNRSSKLFICSFS